MFEHFTFAAAHAQPCERDDISPTDTTYPSPAPPTPYENYPFSSSQSEINDIVNKLSQQRLVSGHKDDHFVPSWQHSLPTPPLEDSNYAAEVSYPDTITACIADTQSVPSTPIHDSVSCRRLQRQLNVQLQTCKSHVRDINALVSDMISRSSQCRLRRIPSRQTLNTHLSDQAQESSFSAVQVSDTSLDGDLIIPEIDECYADNDTLIADQGTRNEVEDNNMRLVEAETSLRRSSTPSGIRKHGSVLRFKKSSDCVSARFQVAKPPRMRRRKSSGRLSNGKYKETT